MPRGKAKKLSCPKCGRKFSMQAHLVRHLNGTHGAKPSLAAKRAAAKRRMGTATRGRRMSRNGIVAAGLDLAAFSLEQLREVIDVARSEARMRLEQLENVFR